MNAANFRRWISGVVTVTLAGCGWPSEDSDWVTPTCTEFDWTPLSVIQPAQAHDYVALYSGGPDFGAQLIDEMGDRCVDATNTDCDDDMVQLDNSLFSAHLRTTDGGVVETWTGGSVLSFLGEIDTPDEALMVGWSMGGGITCDDLEQTAVRAVDDGWEIVTSEYESTCSPLKKIRIMRHVDTVGEVTELKRGTVTFQAGTCIGRRPAGLVEADLPSGDVGAWLAHVAHLEAASVVAFEQLAEELRGHGAPAALISAAREAALDERRHASMMGHLAARYGAVVPPVEVQDVGARSLFELALHNATEGCVRECFGALEGAWQAETAEDPVVAAVMAQVASDEAAHGSLAWAIAAWVEPLLGPSEQQQVRDARMAEVHDLRRAMVEPATDVHRQLGVPRGVVGLQLVDAMHAECWAA